MNKKTPDPFDMFTDITIGLSKSNSFGKAVLTTIAIMVFALLMYFCFLKNGSL